MGQAILTVLGQDKPGIIAAVTSTLAKAGCNLEDVSMTVLEGQFAMIVIVDSRKKDAAGIVRKIESVTSRLGLSCYWKPIKKKLGRAKKHAKGTSPYILSIYGRDRTGIVAQTSQILAARKLNITDLNSKILGRGEQSLYLMILEVDVPKSHRVEALQSSLRRLASKLKVDLTLKPVDTIEI